MATLEYIVGNTYYNLSDGLIAYRTSMVGIGMPTVQVHTERAPQQHGVTDRGFHTQERLLSLILFFKTDSKTLADQRRDQIAHVFKPLKTLQGRLRETRDDGSMREIVCRVHGQVDFPNTPQDARIGNSQTIMVPLLCPSPYFYDPTLHNLTFTTAQSSISGFAIPLEIPWDMDTGSAINAVESVTYAGDAEESPVIYITGPCTSPVITNQTTDEKIDFTGYSIAGGDTWIVDTRWGRWSVVDQNGVSQFSKLTEDSDITYFHLEPDPEAAGGVNEILVEVAGGATDATQIRIEYYDRYHNL